MEQKVGRVKKTEWQKAFHESLAI